MLIHLRKAKKEPDPAAAAVARRLPLHSDDYLKMVYSHQMKPWWQYIVCSRDPDVIHLADTLKVVSANHELGSGLKRMWMYAAFIYSLLRDRKGVNFFQGKSNNVPIPLPNGEVVLVHCEAIGDLMDPILDIFGGGGFFKNTGCPGKKPLESLRTFYRVHQGDSGGLRGGQFDAFILACLIFNNELPPSRAQIMSNFAISPSLESILFFDNWQNVLRWLKTNGVHKGRNNYGPP
jgi:hypothetical protein